MEQKIDYKKRLLDVIKNSDGNYDVEKISQAYDYADNAHQGQKRASGEEYILHPVEVAIILCNIGLDTDSIVGALLHDVVEDTPHTADEIKKLFGQEVALLVDGVTKLGKIPYTSKEEEQIENLRKMFLATARDARVIIIKLADRLHNMRTLEYVDDEKRRRKSHETMEVYAPLAHRLGMQRIKIELEDLALKYLDPIGYAEIENSMKEKEESRQNFLRDMIFRIKQHFGETVGFKFHIDGRVKHVYSIYRKMFRQNKTIEEIYDLYAVRIIVDSIAECYGVLGVIHDMFKPIPGRFKDYISMPKPNLYQSLHTTVIGGDGIPFEVQIRTWDMHRTAEYGIAAHWKYKSNVSGKENNDEKLTWVRKLLEMQTEGTDNEDFMQSFKIDFFADEVFVFTPKGDLVNLPAGATAIDFAYAIHSAVGNKMVGAKVNGKIVTLDYQPQNGDIMEVITSNSAKGPSRDWLKIAKTSEARSKIKAWYKREMREENIQKGKEELERALEENGIVTTQKDRDDLLAGISSRIGFTGHDDLYAAIGYGGIALSKIIPHFKQEFVKVEKPTDEEILATIKPETEQPKKNKDSAIIVEGIDNCLIKFARCCNPLPGEPLIGYITKGYGVSVHRADCKNVLASLAKGDENDRWIHVTWNTQGQSNDFPASLQIACHQRNGLLADISTLLSNMKVSIRSLNARESDYDAFIDITVDVRSTDHLYTIIKKLETISGVRGVERRVR